MIGDQELRAHLASLLNSSDAHVNFETATADLPTGLRGARPSGLPFTPCACSSICVLPNGISCNSP